ncbi:threonine aldolase family protein [Bifidobacterium felsineum]|uniref:threonine aldolase family protein n=1 Tax=Bifidobacterium felsineum TaxID=2045440 RepID=UPI001BDC999C|nr:aminotransferase class I/II-fold pyridoxal phosphate-dependent enzyme [Bifidobacterium felsineum]MBT1163749.1 aminotransferase class I/II-fold pyridoxal phosphate-dependent enzyme [Bifidobacterium felsineum]
MLSFENDYSRAAHPAVLDAVVRANEHLYSGYGSDELTAQAKAKIRKACDCPNADVWFLVGGTQTNQVVIDTITPPYAGVVTVTSGHPNVHEAGAIEFSGHKVLTLPHHNGKMDTAELDEFCKTFYADGNYEHMVFPGCVYVSQSTEYGTMYSKAELKALADVAHAYDMPLFVDGARLGYALTATGSDLTLPDLARIADVFYIGGTKVGALFGEAVVFTQNNTPKHFFTQIKQHGALLAKGFVLGAQFDALFTDDLYFKIARNANVAADRIREALKSKGYQLTFEAPTNQIFVTLDQPTIDRLAQHVKLGFTEKADDTHTVMRICTSWATTKEEVDQLIELL